VSPMNRANYPPNWEELSHFVRVIRARGYCEGSPAYPNCKARSGHNHPVTGSYVILTTAHMDHDKTNNDLSNLRALCQRCHLTHDLAYHTANRAANQRARLVAAGQLELFPRRGSESAQRRTPSRPLGPEDPRPRGVRLAGDLRAPSHAPARAPDPPAPHPPTQESCYDT
jgi:hypothetical protein